MTTVSHFDAWIDAAFNRALLRECEKRAIAADWARFTDAVSNRLLRASRRVGRKASFEEFAAEFALGPRASSQRKSALKRKLSGITVRYRWSRHLDSENYLAELKSAFSKARRKS